MSAVADFMPLQTANATAVSIALPTIGIELGIEEDQLQWLVSSYSITAVRLFECHGLPPS